MTDEAQSGGDAPAVESGAPIDADVQSRPEPLGSQVPPKAEDQPGAEAEKAAEPKEDEKPKNLRDALKKATEDTKAKQAEKDAAKGDKDAKADEPAKAAEKKDAQSKVVEQAKTPVESQQDAPQQPKQLTDDAPFRDAPKRYDEAAARDWAETPESVRGATHRVIKEMEDGIREHQERWEPLKEYDDLAQQHGTNLPDALKRYVAFETQLNSDPVRGLESICADKGLNLRAVAAHIVGQKPEQVQTEMGNTIAELRTEVTNLKQQLGGVTQSMGQQTEREVQNTIQGFVSSLEQADQKLYEYLSPQIAAKITEGNDLANAFRLAKSEAQQHGIIPANGAHTATPPAQAQTQQPKPANPAGQKSVSGAPSSGSEETPKSKRRGQVPSIREAIRQSV